MGEKSDRADTKGSGQAYTRQPFLIVHREAQRRKDIYGSIGDNIVLQAQHLRPVQDSKRVIIAMHPIGSPGYLPMFSGLARAGNHVVACATRYANGDAALQMENVLLDLGACVRDARERLGYESVVLAGWSGGGSLMAGYQAEAEKPQITQTAAGEPTALADTELLPADAVLLLAAHRSRHHLVTDFLDASITDEVNPERHEADLDLYGTDASSAAAVHGGVPQALPDRPARAKWPDQRLRQGASGGSSPSRPAGRGALLLGPGHDGRSPLARPDC